MSEVDLDDIKRRMEGSLNSLKTEFMGLRAGRASTGMLEPVMVDAYGSKDADVAGRQYFSSRASSADSDRLGCLADRRC